MKRIHIAALLFIACLAVSARGSIAIVPAGGNLSAAIRSARPGDLIVWHVPGAAYFTPTTWYVRSDGSSTTNCTGKTNAAYTSGTAQPCAYSNLQDALNAAVGGDTIILRAGDTFDASAGFTLPAHSGASYVTVTSSGTLPAGRVGPSDTAQMARVRTTDNTNALPTFTLGSAANYWKLDGLEITNNTTLQINVMVALCPECNAGSAASHITLNRLVMHPKECPNTTPPYNTTGRFAIQANVTDFTLTNSYVYCFFGLPPGGTTGQTGVDTMTFVSDAGPLNPGLIQNNYLESWYQMGLIGGADPTATSTATVSGSPTLTTATLSNVTGLSIGQRIAFAIPWEVNFCKNGNTRTCYGNGAVTNIVGNVVTYTSLICNNAGGSARVNCNSDQFPLVPGDVRWNGQTISNLTINQNIIHSPTAFAQWVLDNNGNHPKGSIEFKLCDTCTITANTFEGFAPGAVLNFESTNQNGGCPWCVVKNITVQNNWFKEFSHLNVSATDAYYLSTNGGNFTFTNNLLTSPDRSSSASHPGGLIVEGRDGAAPISFIHNTILTGYPTSQQKALSWAISDSPAPSGVIFRDNMAGWGNYGYTCNTSPFTVATCWPGMIENHNLFVLTENPPNTAVVSEFPNSVGAPGTVPNYTAAKLVGTCDKDNVIDNCALQANSPGHNAASDGTDIGANIATIKAVLAGSPTPTPTPVASPSPSPSPSPSVSPTPNPNNYTVSGVSNLSDGSPTGSSLFPDSLVCKSDNNHANVISVHADHTTAAFSFTFAAGESGYVYACQPHDGGPAIFSALPLQYHVLTADHNVTGLTMTSGNPCCFFPGGTGGTVDVPPNIPTPTPTPSPSASPTPTLVPTPTPSPTPTPVPAPTGVSAVPVSETRNDVSFSVSGSPDLVSVEACSTANCSNFVEITTTTGTVISDSGLVGSTIRRYRLRAKKGGVYSAYTSTVQAETVVAMPTGFTATATNANTAHFTWSFTNADQTFFGILRSTDNATFTLLYQVAPTLRAFDDFAGAPSTTYYYRIYSQNANGNSASSNSVTVTTPLTPVVAPLAPIISSAQRASSTSAVVLWSQQSGNDTGVKVEYSLDRIIWTQHGVSAAHATAYTVTGLTPKLTYYFRVRATNSAGDSPYSGTVSATTNLLCLWSSSPPCQ